ncbi:MAG: class I SAM-dependent methyltransferase [Pyrinomonadaceae bacterium]
MDETQLEAVREDLLRKPSPGHILSRLKVRWLIGRVLRNNKLQMLRRRDSDYVNLGCGGNVLKGFFNIDYGWCRGIDLCWDVSRGIPLPSKSASGVFTEHMLEHFEWQDALNIILPEIKRILKPGGTIRISVPDAEMAIDEYTRAKSAGETSKPWNMPHHDQPNRLHMTPMGEVNNTFRRLYEPYYMGHKFGYDFQTLEHFLFLTGFVDIKRVAYMQGRDQNLLVDYKKRAGESLYVEAAAP